MKNLFTNLFQKQTPQQSTVIQQDTKELIDKIHNEFYCAGDDLLREANEIISSNVFSEEKTNQLKKFGFTSVPEVVEVEQKVEKKKIAHKTIELVQKYHFKYPNNKFITKDMVEEICKKYNLVFGDVSLYKGFVPLHNLKQIEDFYKKHPFNTYSCVDEFGKTFTIDMSDFEIKRSEISPQYFHFYPKDINIKEHSFQSREGVNFYGRDYSGLICSKSIFVSRMTKDSTIICAPLKDMNTEGMNLKGYELKKHIPDPVVLQPVEFGYLIISAWGDEASDELVVNEINN